MIGFGIAEFAALLLPRGGFFEDKKRHSTPYKISSIAQDCQ